MFQDPNALTGRYANEHVAWEKRLLHQGATPSPSSCAKVKRQVSFHLPEREVFRHCFLVARKSIRRIPRRRVSARRKIYIRNRARLRLSQRHRSLLVNHCKTISYFKFLVLRLNSRRPDQKDPSSPIRSPQKTIACRQTPQTHSYRSGYPRRGQPAPKL